MRSLKPQTFLLALFLGLSVFGLGCGREPEERDEDRRAAEQEVEQEEVRPEDEVVTEDPELQPEQRVVVVEPETGEDPGAQIDLEERERRLAERRAELEAREQRLREAEIAQRDVRLREREQELRERREERRAEPERRAETERQAEPERQARVPQPQPQPRPTQPRPQPRVEREPEPEPVETEEIAKERRGRTADEDREAAELAEERRAREREERAEREAREQEAREREAREEEERASQPAPLVVEVPAGTVMEVELLEGLSSQTTKPGEIFRARIASDVGTDGTVGIPAGAEVLGVVTEAVPLGKVGGQAKLGLKFTDLVLPSGKTIPIDASLVQQGRSETRRDAATIGGAAAGGAILGRVINRKDRSRGAVIGAIIGAAAGAVLASRNGEEVVIPEGTRLDLKLDDDVEVRARGR